MRQLAFVIVLGAFAAALPGWAQEGVDLAVGAANVAECLAVASRPAKGEVVAVDPATDPATIYVLMPETAWVGERQALDVFAKGDPILKDGETVGYLEEHVGTAEIIRVQSDRISIATMRTTEPGQQPAVGCVAYVKPVPLSLAVGSFLLPGAKDLRLGKQLADRVREALQFTGRFRVVERARLESALSALRMRPDDLYVRDKTGPLGRQMGVRGVVTGTLATDDMLALHVVELETGSEVFTAQVPLRAMAAEAVPPGDDPTPGTQTPGGAPKNPPVQPPTGAEPVGPYIPIR